MPLPPGFNHGEFKVNPGVARRSPTSRKYPPGCCERVALMPSKITDVCGELESMSSDTRLAGAVLVSTVIPLLKAEENVARLSWFTDKRVRGLLVFSRAASKLTARQSLVGWVSKASCGLALP